MSYIGVKQLRALKRIISTSSLPIGFRQVGGKYTTYYRLLPNYLSIFDHVIVFCLRGDGFKLFTELLVIKN